MHKFDLNKFQGYLCFVLGVYFKIAINKNFNGKKRKGGGTDNPSISYFLTLATVAGSLLFEAVLYWQAVPANRGTKAQFLPVAHPGSILWSQPFPSMAHYHGQRWKEEHQVGTNPADKSELDILYSLLLDISVAQATFYHSECSMWAWLMLTQLCS